MLGGISTENQKSLVRRCVSKDVVGAANAKAARAVEWSGRVDRSTCSHTFTGKAVPVSVSKWPSCQTSAVADKNTNTVGNTNVPNRLRVLSRTAFTNAMRSDLMFDTFRLG